MLRKWWATAVAVGGLVVAGQAAAGDEAVRLGRFTPPPAAGFAGGTGAAAPAANPGPDSDTELTHWRRGWGGYGWGGYGWGGYSSFYRPYYGGYGWGGYPYYGGWGGYSSFYRPSFAFSYYSYPRFYSPWYGGGWGGYGFYGISGTGVALNTPAVQLNLAVAPRQPAPVAPAVRPVPAQPAPGTYQYDGGPSNPVPAPQAEPSQPLPAPAADATAMRVARPAAKPVYKFTAYGERR